MTLRDMVLSPAFWIVLAVVLVTTAYFVGRYQGQVAADSDYLQQRDKNLKQIAVHEAKAAELATENERLRQENAAKAEALRESDTAAEAKRAAEFQRLQDEREKKGEEIENASPEENLAGLCADAAKAGLRLSFCE